MYIDGLFEWNTTQELELVSLWCLGFDFDSKL